MPNQYRLAVGRLAMLRIHYRKEMDAIFQLLGPVEYRAARQDVERTIDLMDTLENFIISSAVDAGALGWVKEPDDA